MSPNVTLGHHEEALEHYKNRRIQQDVLCLYKIIHNLTEVDVSGIGYCIGNRDTR